MKNREALMKFISTQGYKRNSPDVNNPVNVIPTGNITMQDVDFPVRGVDNLGNEIIMQPGMNYQFPGEYVVETPMAQDGGIFNQAETLPAFDFDWVRPKARITLKDTRKINATTGKPVNPNTDLVSGNYDADTVKRIVRYARQHGVDPYTALSIGLQETKLGATGEQNVGHTTSIYGSNDDAEDMVLALKTKLAEANRLGLKDEASRLQVYNGMGTVTPKTEKDYHGYEMQKIYGVPIPKEGINMRKNPLYGKRIIDLRDNVLKNNDSLVKYVDSVNSTINPFTGKPNNINTVPSFVPQFQDGGVPETTVVPRLTPQQKRAQLVAERDARNAARLAPIRAAQEQRINDFISQNPGSTPEDYWKWQEKRNKGADVGIPGMAGGSEKCYNATCGGKGFRGGNNYQFGGPQDSNSFNYNNLVKGDELTHVTDYNKLSNLENNNFNKFLRGVNNLSDPRNMTWALPNRGFFGKVKALSGAASGLSGAILGYEKLFAPDKTESYINNYNTKEHGSMNDVLNNRALKDSLNNGWDTKEMYQESPVDKNAHRRFTTPGSDLYPVQNGVAAHGGTMRKYQPGGYVPDFQKWYLDNLSRPDIVANVQNQEELVNIYNKDMDKSGTPTTQNQVTSPGVNSPKFNQYPISTVHGDGPGIIAANNALLGFGMINQVLGEQDLEKEYNKRLRELGNTDARYNASNATNPFGNYTLNAGPASNFALVANTPIQDFGTRRASAKRGGTVYEEGGEYYATKDDIKKILAAGGEIEYID